MFPPPAGTRRTAVAAVLAGALLLTAACRSEPPLDIGDPIETDADPVIEVTGVESAVWGSGRGLLSRTASDGNRVVVTTTGVFVRAEPGTAPEPIHSFDRPTFVGNMAISPDAATLIVSTSTPPQVLWFDLTTGALTQTQDLEVGSSLTNLSFLPDASGVVAGSRSGLITWPDGPASGPVPVTDPSTPVGSSAVLADGRVVAPLAESTTLTVIDGLDSTFVAVDLAEPAILLDAMATRAGDALAVSVSDGPDRLASTGRILLLDPATFATETTLEVDRALVPGSWSIVSDHVVALNGSTIELWPRQGGPSTTLTDGREQAIDRLVPVDGGVIALYADGAMTIWDATTWTPRGAVDGGVTLTDVAVDPDGRTLTSVDFHGRAQRWDTTTGAAIDDLADFAVGRSNHVAIDPSGTQVGAVSSSGHVAILDITLSDGWVFQESAANIDTIAFNPTTELVSTGLAERTGDLAFDDTVTTWDASTRVEQFRLGGESEDVAGCSFFYNRIRFTSDGALMAATSHDFSISIVDAATGTLVDRVPPQTTTVLDIAFTPDDDLLVVTTDDARVIVLETSDYSALAEYQAPMGGYLGVAMLPDSATMAAIDLTGAIALVDIMTGERLLDFADTRHRTATIDVSVDGTLLAAPIDNSAIGLWSTATGAQLTTLYGHTAAVTGLDFAPDGAWLASSSLDGTVRTWTLTTTR